METSASGQDAGQSGDSQTNPPANWYPDPSGQPQWRYWDGSSWTDHYAPYSSAEGGGAESGGSDPSAVGSDPSAVGSDSSGDGGEAPATTDSSASESPADTSASGSPAAAGPALGASGGIGVQAQTSDAAGAAIPSGGATGPAAPEAQGSKGKLKSDVPPLISALAILTVVALVFLVTQVIL